MNIRSKFLIFSSTILVAGLGLATLSNAQRTDSYFEVSQSLESITIPQGSSKRLKFSHDVPELHVENQTVIQVTPMSSDEIMISGLQAGHSALTISDPNNRFHEIQVIVEMDVRPLELAYSKHFPDSRITVSPLKQGIMLTGFVTNPEQIDAAVKVANDYFGANVVHRLQVQTSQNIAVQIKVYEVSRSKLRRLGVDWALRTPNFNLTSGIAGIISNFGQDSTGVVAGGQDFSGGIIGDDSSFRSFIQFLEQRDVARLLDEPVLITKNGRPAEFLKGGEIPFLIAQGLGTNSFEFRPFGTKLDIVPMLEGNGMMTLEVRAEVSEPSQELGGDTGLPGFKVSRVNTGVTMRTGHTLALAGHYREKNSNNVRGTPGVMDRPVIGTMFRRVQDEFNETELLFLITPNFISEVESGSMAQQMPGQFTQSPSDRELYLNAHSEVPRCQDDCPVNRNLGPQPMVAPPGTPRINGAIEENFGEQAPAGVGQRNRQQYRHDREASQSNGFNWPTNRR